MFEAVKALGFDLYPSAGATQPVKHEFPARRLQLTNIGMPLAFLPATRRFAATERFAAPIT